MRRFLLTRAREQAQGVCFDDGSLACRWFVPGYPHGETWATVDTFDAEVVTPGCILQTEDGTRDDPQPVVAWPHRRFELDREQDVSGVSGTGVVAQGVEYSDGYVALRWLGEHPSSVEWASLDAAMATHGHGGLTTVRWIDGEDTP